MSRKGTKQKYLLLLFAGKMGWLRFSTLPPFLRPSWKNQSLVARGLSVTCASFRVIVPRVATKWSEQKAVLKGKSRSASTEKVCTSSRREPEWFCPYCNKGRKNQGRKEGRNRGWKRGRTGGMEGGSEGEKDGERKQISFYSAPTMCQALSWAFSHPWFKATSGGFYYRAVKGPVHPGTDISALWFSRSLTFVTIYYSGQCSKIVQL